VGADGLLQVTPYYNRPTQDGSIVTSRRSRTRFRCDDPLQRPRPHGVRPPARTPLRAWPSCRRLVGVKEATGSALRALRSWPRSATTWWCCRATTPRRFRCSRSARAAVSPWSATWRRPTCRRCGTRPPPVIGRRRVSCTTVAAAGRVAVRRAQPDAGQGGLAMMGRDQRTSCAHPFIDDPWEPREDSRDPDHAAAAVAAGTRRDLRHGGHTHRRPGGNRKDGQRDRARDRGDARWPRLPPPSSAPGTRRWARMRA